MRKIIALICVLWGGAILVRTYFEGLPEGTGNYALGQWLGIVFGVLLFGAGFAALFKRKPKKRKSVSWD